jgi:catechol 2,3-dioxygenase-like lactoylglutathione lyase family enzyme
MDGRPVRPRILGIAKVRILTSAPPDAERLYFRVFGLAAFPGSTCDDVSLSCLGLNDHQFLSLFPSYWPEDNSRISEIMFETSDVDQLFNYLDSAGVTVSDLQGLKGGNRHFSVRDPEGHRIGFIQYAEKPKLNSPAKQVSGHLIHAGFVVKDRAAEDHFFKDILGFHVYWHGGRKDDETSWVDMQVPDGTDWIEYMLNVPDNADHHTLGVMNHIALGVPDIKAAREQLIKNGWKPGEEPKIGRGGKWQLNVYDPDETRVEFMEFAPVQKPCCSEYTGPHPGQKR